MTKTPFQALFAVEVKRILQLMLRNSLSIAVVIPIFLLLMGTPLNEVIAITLSVFGVINAIMPLTLIFKDRSDSTMEFLASLPVATSTTAFARLASVSVPQVVGALLVTVSMLVYITSMSGLPMPPLELLLALYLTVLAGLCALTWALVAVLASSSIQWAMSGVMMSIFALTLAGNRIVSSFVTDPQQFLQSVVTQGISLTVWLWASTSGLVLLGSVFTLSFYLTKRGLENFDPKRGKMSL